MAALRPTSLLSGQTPETVARAAPERAMMPAVRCPTGCLINPRSFSPPVFPQRLDCPDPADCPVMPDLPRLPRSASEVGFVVRYWPWRSSARRYGTTSNRKTSNTLCATQWSSRRSPKTQIGICFSALIALEDFLSWW